MPKKSASSVGEEGASEICIIHRYLILILEIVRFKFSHKAVSSFFLNVVLLWPLCKNRKSYGLFS